MMDSVKKYTPLNFELMGNPVNWVILFLMVLFAGLALSLVFHPTDAKTGD
ncbi:MAG: hypothetical protein KGJ13_06650 [Patescibacteria group bacterium]|nr:hypothetical protein [Patescibacteria group bacterium]